jgi:hypothetical protein
MTNSVKPGDVAGHLTAQGYWRISVDGRRYLAHRLAWLYVHGEWPAAQIDHVDLDKSNNRFANLREATNAQNKANTRARKDNTSGFKGASWDKRSGRWRARICVVGKDSHLGFFDSAETAHAAYCQAANEAFGEFAREASGQEAGRSR